MVKFQIKTEYMPARCDICHQADCFDAERNYCSRCVGSLDETTVPYNRITEYPSTAQLGFLSLIKQHVVLNWIYLGMVGGVIGGGILMAILGLFIAFQAEEMELLTRFMAFFTITFLGAFFFGVFGVSIGALIGLFVWLSKLILSAISSISTEKTRSRVE